MKAQEGDHWAKWGGNTRLGADGEMGAGWGVKGPGAGVERDTYVQASGGLQPVTPAEGLPLLTRLLRGDAVSGLGSPGPRMRGRGGTHL